MKLFLSDRKFEAEPLSPSLRRLKDFLDRSKPGELFYTSQLSRLSKVGKQTLEHDYRIVSQYQYIHRHKKYWGSVATIKQLKKECEKNA